VVDNRQRALLLSANHRPPSPLVVRAWLTAIAYSSVPQRGVCEPIGMLSRTAGTLRFRDVNVYQTLTKNVGCFNIFHEQLLNSRMRSRLPVGLPPEGRVIDARALQIGRQAKMGSWACGLSRLRTWNITSLAGNEPELVQEV